MKTYSWAQCMKIKYHLLVLYYSVSGNIGTGDLSKITFSDFYSMYSRVGRNHIMEKYLWQKMEESAVDFESMETLLVLSIYQLKALCPSGCCHSKGDYKMLHERFRKTRDSLINRLIAKDYPFGNWQSLCQSLFLACDKKDSRDMELLWKFLQKCADKASSVMDWSQVLAFAFLSGHKDLIDEACIKVFGSNISPSDLAELINI